MSVKMSKNLKKQILQQIKKRKIKVKSNFNIWAQRLGLGSGVVLAVLSLVFLAAATIYWIRTNQDLLIHPFRQGRGLQIFLLTFPYLLIMTAIVLFILLSWLLKKYDFSYKKPFLAIFSVLIGLVIIVGLWSHQHPFLAHFFRRHTRTGQWHTKNRLGFVIGEVVKKETNQFLVTDNISQQKFIILFDNNTFFPRQKPKIGSLIRAIGKIDKNKVNAEVIVNLDAQKNFFPKIPKYRNRYSPSPVR
jgi:hypothetical protein